MQKLPRKRSEKTGSSPGTLVHIGERKAEKVRIHIIDYDPENLQEKDAQSIDECFAFKDKSTVTWINIDGLHEIDILEKLGERYGVHPLVLEDILNTNQRPKMDDFEDYLFIVLRVITLDEESYSIETEQISLLLGQNFVISLQEKEGDLFDPIRERIRMKKGRIRKVGADYLAYSLLDVIVDNYFLVLERLGTKIASLEEDLIAEPSSDILREIHSLRRKVASMRKVVWSTRELINGLRESESPLIADSTSIFIKDAYDHIIQVIDAVETFREMLGGMIDIYLSSTSNKMNEAMKVLSIIATIFIPLSFVAGVYGMNFKNMPELEWQWGYFVAIGSMILIGLSMAIYFKIKHWF